MWKKNDVPCWRTLSHCRLWPNVVQNVPLIGGHCLTVDFDQMWSKMCLLLEDFVSLRIHQMWSKMCPLLEDFVSLRTSTRCGPNMCPSLEDFVTLRTSTKCGPNMCPLTEDFVLLPSLTTYGSTTCSSSKRASTKQTVSKHQSVQNWNHHLRLRCHMIYILEGIRTNEPWKKMTHLVSITQKVTNDKWRGSHTAITDTASYHNERGKHSYRIYLD